MKPSKLFASNVSLLFWRIPLEKLVDEDNDDGDDDDDDDDDNDDDDDEDDVEVDNDENDDDNKARNVCLLDNHSFCDFPLTGFSRVLVIYIYITSRV